MNVSISKYVYLHIFYERPIAIDVSGTNLMGGPAAIDEQALKGMRGHKQADGPGVVGAGNRAPVKPAIRRIA
jgi:hypothetical protein